VNPRPLPDIRRHPLALRMHREKAFQKQQTPLVSGGCVVLCRPLSACDNAGSEWRRRELNPLAFLTQATVLLVVAKNARTRALHWRCIWGALQDNRCRWMSPRGTDAAPPNLSR